MKVICVENNHECGPNKTWTPGKVYQVFTQLEGLIGERRCITTNNPNDFFEISFVSQLDIAFKPLRNANLDELI